MTRTPDEIKKGLECHINGECNQSCPYFGIKFGCGPHMVPDALALIQQLEADKKRILENAVILSNAVKQLEAERDAAVADLKSYRCCHGCKHLGVGFNEPCLHCDFENNCFEWRGVQKED